MRALVIVTGFLFGPSMLLILARRLGGEKPVRMIWRWALRWVYGFILATFIVLIWQSAPILPLEGGEGLAMLVALDEMIWFVLSGAITWGAYVFLTRKTHP